MNSDQVNDKGEQAIESPKAVDKAVEQLCREAAHSLKVRAPRLEFPFFRTTGITTAVTPLITGDRRNQIQILIDDEQHFLDSGNRVIDLARKFSSYVEVRKLPAEYSQSGEIFIVADLEHCLYLKSAGSFPARYSRHSPGQARQLDHRFRKMWERSEHIAALHPVGL